MSMAWMRQTVMLGSRWVQSADCMLDAEATGGDVAQGITDALPTG